MTMLGIHWATLASLQPHRCHRVAWFLYGWIEREHVLNVNSCANWWMRAMGSSASRLGAPSDGSRTQSPAGRATSRDPRK